MCCKQLSKHLVSLVAIPDLPTPRFLCELCGSHRPYKCHHQLHPYKRLFQNHVLMATYPYNSSLQAWFVEQGQTYWSDVHAHVAWSALIQRPVQLHAPFTRSHYMTMYIIILRHDMTWDTMMWYCLWCVICDLWYDMKHRVGEPTWWILAVAQQLPGYLH